jgi:hypothetical protein
LSGIFLPLEKHVPRKPKKKPILMCAETAQTIESYSTIEVELGMDGVQGGRDQGKNP